MLYSWYGDDFTGATDVLDTLACSGVSAALFLSPPTPVRLARFPALEAIGIAGDSRSRSPEWMSQNLGDIFRAMKAFGAPVTHYKTCSTFDSSPRIGNIGRAMEIGLEIFGTRFVPIVVGAPHLGRYVAFGNLFAAANGVTYRIDDHPTMSRHPITPMLEADLRKHLALQTDLRISLLDLRHLSRQALDAALAAGSAAVLFDTVDDVSLSAVGQLLWSAAQVERLFAIGSSGLTESLVATWRDAGVIGKPPQQTTAQGVEQIVVLSGSCSPVTAGQIEWAISHGFDAIPVSPATLIYHPEEALDRTLRSIEAGGSPVIFSAIGPLASATAPQTDELGTAMGNLLRKILSLSRVRRVVLCGGDTSSHAMQQLPIDALTWAASTVPGAPLCRTHADNLLWDGLEFVLKGGQVGPVDFFRSVRG